MSYNEDMDLEYKERKTEDVKTKGDCCLTYYSSLQKKLSNPVSYDNIKYTLLQFWIVASNK
jgi:hypothetical protein